MTHFSYKAHALILRYIAFLESIDFFPIGEAAVIYKTAAPEELTQKRGLCFVWIYPILIAFMLYHQYLVFWVSTYHLMVSLLTLAAVETKKLLVHKDGIFSSCGNFSRSAKEVAPLSWCMISEGLSAGRQLKNRCA